MRYILARSEHPVFSRVVAPNISGFEFENAQLLLLEAARGYGFLASGGAR